MPHHTTNPGASSSGEYIVRAIEQELYAVQSIVMWLLIAVAPVLWSVGAVNPSRADVRQAPAKAQPEVETKVEFLNRVLSLEQLYYTLIAVWSGGYLLMSAHYLRVILLLKRISERQFVQQAVDLLDAHGSFFSPFSSTRGWWGAVMGIVTTVAVFWIGETAISTIGVRLPVPYYVYLLPFVFVTLYAVAVNWTIIVMLNKWLSVGDTDRAKEYLHLRALRWWTFAVAAAAGLALMLFACRMDPRYVSKFVLMFAGLFGLLVVILRLLNEKTYRRIEQKKGSFFRYLPKRLDDWFES